MKAISSLTLAQVVTIVEQIRDILYLSDRPIDRGGIEEFFDADKEYDAEMLDDIALILMEHDVAPEHTDDEPKGD